MNADEPTRDPSVESELEKLQKRQQHELLEFQTEQSREVRVFEEHEQRDIEHLEQRLRRDFIIKIDRTEYDVHERTLTGSQIRQIPEPPIGDDRDLFEVVPGSSDRKIDEHTIVEMRDGLRFFTAPARINPGSVK